MSSLSQECLSSDQFSISSLLDGLEHLDEQVSPFGLYACEEYQMKDKPYLRHHQEWHLGIKPVLLAQCCTLGCGDVRAGIFTFQLPDGTPARLQIARTSKIKVRKFGSRYRVDSQEKYPERWRELHVDDMLWNLWRPTSGWQKADLRLLILIGFDSKPLPLEHELNDLAKSVPWEKRGTAYDARVWPDRYQRDFSIRLSGWSYRSMDNAGY